MEAVSLMNRLNRTLAIAATLALGLPIAAAAQGGGFTVDDALANKGKTLWTQRGCTSCHIFGKVGAGPDLVGVERRRSAEWLQRWLKDTKAMLETDSVAIALLAEFKGVKMPQFKLTDPEIDALVHYMVRESGKKSK